MAIITPAPLRRQSLSCMVSDHLHSPFLSLAHGRSWKERRTAPLAQHAQVDRLSACDRDTAESVRYRVSRTRKRGERYTSHVPARVSSGVC